MKPGLPPPADPELRSLLRTWQPEVDLPPDFHETVWRRLVSAQTSRPSWQRWLQRVASIGPELVRRPAFAAAYLTAIVLVGLSLGYWQAEAQQHRTEATWQTAYLESVSPVHHPGAQ